MNQWLVALLGSTAGFAAYGLVFGVLLAAGFGLPLPEDIPLVMGGVLVHRGNANLYVMIAVGYLGIVIGDSIMFALGRRIGGSIATREGKGFFGRIVTPDKRARVEGLFKKHGEKIVMIARFLPGVRTVTYFTAGSVGMKYSHFLIYDSIASLLSAPVFVILGYKFGDDIESLLARVAKGERGVVIGLLVLIVAAFVFRRWRAGREKKANAAALAKKLQSQSAEVIAPPAKSAETTR